MIAWIRGSQKRTEQLTLEVTAQSREAVWERTESLMHSLGAAEARGYARARARAAVTRTADTVIRAQRDAVSPRVREQIIEKSLESVVDWVVQRRRATEFRPAQRRAA
ncbi:MAG: hypothetical protein KDB14_31905 [Planctomycetales bacterium]|nr:hypothetical protein [Planctomycetales bacterium]